MRVLVVHNRYSSSMPSGENRVVDDEITALRSAGVEVETLMPTSDSIGQMNMAGKVGAALSPVFGLSSSSELNRALKAFRPDVVHLHNPYPLISPTAITVCNRAGIPVVATIHNFRLRCINGLFYRDGRICTDCEDRRVALPGLIHGCYRGSRVQSAVMAAAVTRHRNTWDGVSRYIAVSEFIADRLFAWGESEDKVTIKPNSAKDPGASSPIGEGFLFAGRISEEKGIMLLLDAWELSGLGVKTHLVVAGDGPQRSSAQSRAQSLSGVSFVGNVGGAELSELHKLSAASVYSSTWLEAHGAVAEAFAHGRPVVATGVGALDTLIDDRVGWRSLPEAASLAAALQSATDRLQLQKRGTAARERFIEVFHPDVVMKGLLAVYESVAA